MATTDEKVPCASCGRAILPRTARENAARCVPCFRTMKASGEKVPCVSCGEMILPVTAESNAGRCAPCSRKGSPVALKVLLGVSVLGALLLGIASLVAGPGELLGTTLKILAGVAALVLFAGAMGAMMTWLERAGAGGDRGEFRCNRCDGRFSAEEIERHAQRVAQLSAARVAELFGIDDVSGSVTVVKGGLAYCPRCVTSVAGVSRPGRTVEHDRGNP